MRRVHCIPGCVCPLAPPRALPATIWCASARLTEQGLLTSLPLPYPGAPTCDSSSTIRSRRSSMSPRPTSTSSAKGSPSPSRRLPGWAGGWWWRWGGTAAAWCCTSACGHAVAGLQAAAVIIHTSPTSWQAAALCACAANLPDVVCLSLPPSPPTPTSRLPGLTRSGAPPRLGPSRQTQTARHPRWPRTARSRRGWRPGG